MKNRQLSVYLEAGIYVRKAFLLSPYVWPMFIKPNRTEANCLNESALVVVVRVWLATSWGYVIPGLLCLP